MTSITDPLKLPCGAVLKNRLVKAAMSENMSTNDHTSSKLFVHAYDTWNKGETGLLITGNVMVDSKHLGEARNIVIENGQNSGFDQLQKWAQAGTANNTHLWMQINHPGKQSPKFLSKTPVAPSAVPYTSKLGKMFNSPRELTESEIEDIILRFCYTAEIAKKAGFTGVQIHGAHGYLVSQFLSPKHNIRKDQWGGSLENRMRFLMCVYNEMRKKLGNDFPISLKLNSSDFQQGGFSEEDSISVAKAMADAGIDLIEISGGTYESPVMTGAKQEKSLTKNTLKREAYFLEYCKKIRLKINIPLMLTGGFRSLEGMRQAIELNSCDLIGLARPLAINPNFSKEVLSGDKFIKSEVKPITTGFKKLDRMLPLEILWYTNQIHRLAHGKKTTPDSSPLIMIFKNIISHGVENLRFVRNK
ncbi:MAG: NADH:flavin oxidoreductase/NADH oxidase family protein [Bdellovibrionota bacterium]